MPPKKSASGSSGHRRPASKEGGGDETPMSVLWVGNLSTNTVDPDVMQFFSEFGAVDCNTMHGARSYSFVFFRSIEDAKAAKVALQGSTLHGNTVKIEFARRAKAVKHLWIGGISSSVTKEQLEEEFFKFGNIEDCKFLRDRNSALIDYYKIEDAIAAQKNLNGKCLGGEQLCVEFQRSQPPRKDWPGHQDLRIGLFSSWGLGLQEHLLPHDGRGFDGSSYHGPKRHMPYGGQRDGHPSNVLWIGYPPSIQIDELRLHNAMILFGEIERIKCFPSRNYSFVEFRSVDEARRAKEGLQGRLFNDPRIQILFSSSEFAPCRGDPLPLSGFGPRPEMFFHEGPIGPLQLYAPVRPMAPSSFPGSFLPSNMPGSNILMRPLVPQGFDLYHGRPGFHNFGVTAMPPNWGPRSPLASGIYPSPSIVHPPLHPPFRPMPSSRDVVREAKRSRMEGSSSDSACFHARRVDGEGVGDPFGFSHPNRGPPSESRPSPVLCGDGELHRPETEYIWHGIIAKGGIHVCRARCVAIGKGIDAPLPEIVNCSARTGLDLLMKHYANAIGSDFVLFLPDGEDDFSSYTEFLRYLGSKGRAGVAKLDDGTSLFLVPQSDFMSNILNVSGPDRLYGMVLKLPQQSTDATVQPQLVDPQPSSNYMDQQEAAGSQKSYQFVPQNEEQAATMDENRSLYEVATHGGGLGKSLMTHGDEPRAAQPASLDAAGPSAAASRMEVSLTPELIATLASLIPSSNQSSADWTAQMPSGPASRQVSSSASVMHDASMPFQGWRQEQVVVSTASLKQPSHLPQHLGQQFNRQAPHNSHISTYVNIPSGPDHSAQDIADTAVQNSAISMPEASYLLSRTSKNYSIPSQGGQFAGSQGNQQYQFESSITSHSDYGLLQTANAAGVSNQAVQQQLGRTSSAHDQIGNMPQPQIAIPPNQGQQPLTVLSGSGQGSSNGDADRDQRYQSTLQFAANLLLQLQQQQQSSARAVQEHGRQH